MTAPKLSDSMGVCGRPAAADSTPDVLTCSSCGTTTPCHSAEACMWGSKGCKTRPGEQDPRTCWSCLDEDGRVELVEIGCKNAAARMRDERATTTAAVDAALREQLDDALPHEAEAGEAQGQPTASSPRTVGNTVGKSSTAFGTFRSLPAPYEGNPPDVDVTVADPARMYDYWLGGKNNFAVDRELADKAVEAFPGLPMTLRANRACMRRIVTYLAGPCGVDQFLDIGCGFPASNDVHEVAQHIRPDAKVTFVDNSPLVAAHARALLTSTTDAGQTAFVLGDARQPDRILAEVTEGSEGGILDLDRPIAVLLISVLMYFDADTAQRIVQTLVAGIPSGSYLAITHPTADFDTDGSAARGAQAASRPGLSYDLRGRDEIAKLVADLDLVEPGLVPMALWQPDAQQMGPVGPGSAFYYTVLARKP